MFNCTLDYCKYMILNHTIILILCLYVVVYIISNYDVINKDGFWKGNYIRPLMISGIIFLFCYLFIILDDTDEEESIVIPKYKISNRKIPDRLSEENNEDIDRNNRKRENSNIFISQKDRTKFGINF